MGLQCGRPASASGQYTPAEVDPECPFGVLTTATRSSLLFSSLSASASASPTGGTNGTRPTARGDSSTYAHFLEQDEAIVKGVQDCIARFISDFQREGSITTGEQNCASRGKRDPLCNAECALVAPIGVVSAVAQALCREHADARITASASLTSMPRYQPLDAEPRPACSRCESLSHRAVDRRA